MKYIRVLMYNEDSVFEVIEEYEKTIKCKLNNCENGYIVIGKNNVVKQADTIEELCDRFVFEYKKYYENGKIIFRFWRDYLFMEMALETFDDCKIKDKVIYGAIITDKGLIYVAKMNNEGKLCLI